MTPSEIAAKWAPILATFNAIAADIKALTSGLALRLTQSQVDARVDTKIADAFALAPGAYNTLQKIAAEMASDDTAFASLATVVGNKAEASAVTALTGRVTDLEAVQTGIPDFLALYNAAKA
jgi:hypothetical protein